MSPSPSFFVIVALVDLVHAIPLDQKHQARQASIWNPLSPCASCFRSSWTQGPECTTNTILQSTISRVLNPPASETSTYTPTKWCTDYLRQTDWATSYATSSGVSTYTSWTITHLFVTVTDLDHPTSTMFCPIPSSGMECGWDSNTVAPIEQGEDWSIEHYYNPEECQQVCLEHKLCRAYRIDGNTQNGWSCEIFNVGLGRNASNVINPTASGSQWWDRNCLAHIPTACRQSTRTPPPISTTISDPAIVTDPTDPTATTSTPASARPTITTAPTAVPRGLSKRDAPLPPYMSDLSYFWSGMYLTPACSCLISSALPPAKSTSTRTVTSWTASTTVSTTYEDWFTVTTTPRETTVYSSIN
ncbi:hypothetical protein K458DRAFT_103184 [Lentithecium fluviatile CBS 122367]|uniref:Apple domain-containing protein n=1 Tax=Lentithecium fluviatile CBS 122367 TaxID=1168545 RepID=A0A6G1JJU8_9PLEO|nr:hypothetical protein K458DRAFT_103184 [Lentithecium fluviatile CBS 122367]